MGLFLSTVALQCDDRGEDVFDDVFRIVGERGHRRLPKSMALRQTGENQVMVSTESPEWLMVIFPQAFPDGFGCAQLLSEKMDCRVFNFEIYDGETWWYNFFHEGELLDVFWQQPRYFEGIHPDEVISEEILQSRRGQPDLLAEHFFGLMIDLIRPYYVQIDDQAISQLKTSDPDQYKAELEQLKQPMLRKAHQEDLYPLSSVWVFTDFAAKLGISYPVDIQTHDGLRFFALRPAESA